MSKKDKDKCAAKHRRRQERERALELEQARKKEQEEQMAAYLNPVLEDVQREANKYSEAVQGKLLGNAERKRYEASKSAALRIQAAARRKQVRNVAEGAAKQREQARKQEQEEQKAAYCVSPSLPRDSNEQSAIKRQAHKQASSLAVNDGKGGGAEGEEGETTPAQLMGLTVALAEVEQEVEGLTVAAVRQDRATGVKTTLATAAGQVTEVGGSAGGGGDASIAATTTTRTKKARVRRQRVPHHSTPHAQPTLEEIQQQLLQNATRRLPEVSPVRHTMAHNRLMNNTVSLYNAVAVNPPSGGNPTLLGLHNPRPLIVKPRKGGHSRQGHLVQVGTAAKIPAFRPGQTGPPLPASHTAVCSICTLPYPTSGVKDHVHFHQRCSNCKELYDVRFPHQYCAYQTGPYEGQVARWGATQGMLVDESHSWWGAESWQERAESMLQTIDSAIGDCGGKTQKNGKKKGGSGRGNGNSSGDGGGGDDSKSKPRRRRRRQGGKRNKLQYPLHNSPKISDQYGGGTSVYLPALMDELLVLEDGIQKQDAAFREEQVFG